MGGKKNKTHSFLLIGLISLLLGCDMYPNIKVTRDYVYNSNWGKENEASTVVWKIILSDKIKNKDINSLRGFELFNNASLDTSFYFITVPHNNYSIKKIYFNKENENIKWYVRNSTSMKVSTIGKLELDTWYSLGNLYRSWIYYIYVDKEGTVHIWSVNPVNI